MPECEALAHQLRSAYSHVCRVAELGYTTHQVNLAVFSSGEGDGVGESDGLHHCCEVVIAVSSTSENIERQVDLCIRSNKANVARSLCSLCVTHGCIVHRNAKLVKHRTWNTRRIAHNYCLLSVCSLSVLYSGWYR